MASNAQRVPKRVPRVRYVPVDVVKHVQTKAGLVATVVKEVRMETYYDYLIMASSTYGARQPIAVIEDATHKDAVDFIKAPPTEGGHSVKGFRKMKATS